MSLFAFITLLSLVLGIWMFARGRRGRRIDDHPVCARCKFDLKGRPPGSWKCPECGVSLVFESAIQIGNRQRQETLMYTGLAMSLLATLLLVMSMAVLVTNVDTIRFKPTWWLLHDAAHDARPSPQSRDVAELLYRVKSNQLSPTEQQGVVDLGLKLQADLSKPWDPRWGDIIELLNGKGLVSAADWKAYLSQDEPMTLEVRPNVSRGDAIPWHVRGELRGSTPLTTYRNWTPIIASSVPGCASLYPSGGGWGGGGADHFDFQGQTELVPASWKGLKPGSQTLFVTVGGLGSFSAAHPALFPTIHLVGNWMLLADGEKSSQFYHDESTAALVAKSLSARFEVTYDVWGNSSPHPSVTLLVTVDRPPADVALNAFLRIGAKEWEAKGTDVLLARDASTQQTFRCYFSEGPELMGQHADVILRPSPSVAGRSVSMNRLLDHEFVFKDVVIQDGNEIGRIK